MTTVTGTLTEPLGLVTFYLVDQDGRRLYDAFVDGGTIVGEEYVELVAGAYSVTLPGNADIQANATANYWVRGFGLSQRRLLVPVSGTWDEIQIAADPPPASPDPIATNLVTSAAITSAVSGLVVDAFTFANVAGTTVTVPDTSYALRLEGVAPVMCPATPSIIVGTFITKSPDIVNKGADYQSTLTANLPVTCRPVAVLPPHTPGSYLLRVYSFSSVTLTVDAQTGQPAGLWVYAI